MKPPPDADFSVELEALRVHLNKKVLSRSDSRINHQVLLLFSLPLTMTVHCLGQVCYSPRLRFSFCRDYEGILKRPKMGEL